jgi:hypothetical protein
MQTSGRSEDLARARAKVRRRHARGAAEAAQASHERRERGCRGTLGEVARPASGRPPVDDPKDLAEAAGEPILDATGCAKWTGTAAAWKGRRMPLRQPVSMSSMTDNERGKGSGRDGPDASEGWRRRAADD